MNRPIHEPQTASALGFVSLVIIISVIALTTLFARTAHGAGLLVADGGFGGRLQVKEHNVDVAKVRSDTPPAARLDSITRFSVAPEVEHELGPMIASKLKPELYAVVTTHKTFAMSASTATLISIPLDGQSPHRMILQYDKPMMVIRIAGMDQWRDGSLVLATLDIDIPAYVITRLSQTGQTMAKHVIAIRGGDALRGLLVTQQDQLLLLRDHNAHPILTLLDANLQHLWTRSYPELKEVQATSAIQCPHTGRLIIACTFSHPITHTAATTSTLLAIDPAQGDIVHTLPLPAFSLTLASHPRGDIALLARSFDSDSKPQATLHTLSPDLQSQQQIQLSDESFPPSQPQPGLFEILWLTKRYLMTITDTGHIYLATATRNTENRQFIYQFSPDLQLEHRDILTVTHTKFYGLALASLGNDAYLARVLIPPRDNHHANTLPASDPENKRLRLTDTIEILRLNQP